MNTTDTFLFPVYIFTQETCFDLSGGGGVSGVSFKAGRVVMLKSVGDQLSKNHSVTSPDGAWYVLNK